MSKASVPRSAAEEPGGQHAGVVHHETVPLPQQLRELVEVPVFHLPAVLIETEEPGRVPALQRRLCDQLRRQIKVEIGFFQCVHLVFFPTRFA